MTETRIEDVFNWDFPVMGLTTGLKVHRMDFTLACVRYGSLNSRYWLTISIQFQKSGLAQI